MSALLHSEPEDSSGNSSPNSDSNQEFEPPTEEKVPLSTSIMFQRAPKSIQPAKVTKVAIRFLAIGSTPAIQPSAFNIAETQTVATLLSFLMKKLRIKTIHIYVLNSFQPTPDEKIGQLHAMFATNGVLNFSYCESVAFGWLRSFV